MSGSVTSIAALETPRPGLVEAGFRASVVATAFAAAIFATRLSGPTLIEALLACAVIATGAEYMRRRRDSRLIASVPFALAVSVLLGIGIATLGAPGKLAFLPALFILSTFATNISAGPIAVCSSVICLGLAQPALAGDPSQLSWTAPATALVLLVVPQFFCLVSRRGHTESQVTPTTVTYAPDAAEDLHLTRRQSEAVEHAAAGLRQAEIAERMEISIHQVRNLLRQARERNGAGSTRELVARSMATRQTNSPTP